MAPAPFLGPVVPPSIPFPGNRGHDVAFVPSGGYRPDLALPTPRTAAPVAPDLVRLPPGPRPPVAQPPPVGGFDPAAIADALDQGAKAAERLLRDLGRWVGDQWGYWNSRKTTGGSPAAYSRGAYKGSYNPTGSNKWTLKVSGIKYSYDPISSSRPLLAQYLIDQQWLSPQTVGAGSMLEIFDWPNIVEMTRGTIKYLVYDNPPEIKARFVKSDGTIIPTSTQRSVFMFKSDAEFTIDVEPVDPVGALPFFPDIPAVPAVPDPAAQNPYIDSANLPNIDPGMAPRLDPIRQPLIRPAPAPADARPVTEKVPQLAGPVRQLTRQVGLLPRVAPALLPRIAPMPARPIPQYLPQTTPQGDPQLAPAPEPQTTPTDQRQYGPRTVTTTGVRPDLQGIAEEVGRIELKLALVLGDLDQMGPFDLPPFTYGPGAYTLEPVCEFDSQGVPAPAREASWPGGSGELAQLGAKLDALAELLQHHKELKQPICKNSPPIGQPVTVTFEEEPA